MTSGSRMSDDQTNTVALANVRALACIAVERARAQDIQGATAAFEEAVALCLSLGLRAQAALLSLNVADIARDAGDAASALPSYLQCAELAEERGVFVLAYLGRLLAASVYGELGAPISAELGFTWAARAAQAGELERLRINALFLLALARATESSGADHLPNVLEVAALILTIDQEKDNAARARADTMLHELSARLGLPREGAVRRVDETWLLDTEMLTWMTTSSCGRDDLR